MLNQLLIFLPFATCVFWIIIYKFLSKGTWVVRLTNFFLLVSAAYFFADSCYASALTSSDALVGTTIALQFLAPIMMPFLMMFIAETTLCTGKLSLTHMLWITAPLTIFIAELLLIFIMGLDNARRLLFLTYEGIFVPEMDDLVFQTFYFISTYIFRGILILEALAFVIFIIYVLIKSRVHFSDFWNYLFKGKEISPRHLQIFYFLFFMVICPQKAIMQRESLVNNQVLCAIMGIIVSLIIFMICTTCLVFDKETLTRKELLERLRHIGPQSEDEAENENTAPSENVIEQNTETGINEQRVEFAKQFILDNPEATQAEIAKASGFSSASSFNSTFKKYTGLTPRIWAVTQRIPNDKN